MLRKFWGVSFLSFVLGSDVFQLCIFWHIRIGAKFVFLDKQLHLL